ncbi:MAG: hypothetical protein MZV70_27165 [Desulfobacterales bacterium]|nr:hypothetical protein [Desulfobacterales bacterium]
MANDHATHEISDTQRGGIKQKGENQMKKLIFKIVFLTLVVLIPASLMAQVQVRINIPLPPPIIFPAPPHVVVIPETDVYAVPDVNDDIFFYGGWWWRPWEGRWYRSRYYDRGWGHYRGVPSFHRHVPPVGAATIGIAAGKGMNGINAPFRTATLKRTGGAGKETSIGKKKITGV